MDVDHTPILEATANQGFIAPATIAAVLALQERLLIIAILRLGGELHVPGLAEVLNDPPGFELAADIDDQGVYTVRTAPA